MSDKTGIEWTRGDDGTAGATWNPVTGCTKISVGCDHCYAETWAERWRGVPGHHFENGFDVTLRPERLEQPLRWKRPRRIFVNSMSDLFHESVPDGYIACVFTVMAKASHHTFQVLSKRHGRMRSLLSSLEFQMMCAAAAGERGWDLEGTPWPLPNVWLGVSAEDVDMAFDHECGDPPHMHCPPVPDWIIVGGESGPGARPMELAWAREIVKQCGWSGIAPFVKQLGSVLGRELGAGLKGGDWSAWPEDLKVREFPRTAEAATR